MDLLSDLWGQITFDPLTTGDYVALAVTAVLLAISGLVSGSEVALFSLSPQQDKEIQEDKNGDYHRLKQIIVLKDRLLGTILIANNLVNVTIIILLENIMSRVFNFGDAHWLQFILQTILLTFLLLLFGEIVPKIFASNRALRFARFTSSFIYYLCKILSPFSKLLIVSGDFVKEHISHKGDMSMDELSEALNLTSTETEEEKQILQGIIRFGDKDVEEVMTSRLDIFAIEYNESFRKMIKAVIEAGYSRIPVYESSTDNVKGILYLKDLLPYFELDDFDWHTLLREPYFVPNTKKIDSLLKEFQINKVHIAIIVDEFGSTLGLLSLEDILEEIVGEIRDEYDEEERLYEQVAPDTFIFDGKIAISQFQEVLHIDTINTEAETLAGLVLEQKGDFPFLLEELNWRKYTLQVMKLDRRRIEQVKVKLNYEK